MTSCSRGYRATTAVGQGEAAVMQASASSTSGIGRELALDRAKIELALAREQYQAVRRRLGMLELIVANTQFHLNVIDPPTLPLRPSFPRPLLNVSVGLILGILAATTFIALKTVLKGV